MIINQANEHNLEKLCYFDRQLSHAKHALHFEGTSGFSCSDMRGEFLAEQNDDKGDIIKCVHFMITLSYFFQNVH